MVNEESAQDRCRLETNGTCVTATSRSDPKRQRRQNIFPMGDMGSDPIIHFVWKGKWLEVGLGGVVIDGPSARGQEKKEWLARDKGSG